LLEGSQASPARPSDKGSMEDVKMFTSSGLRQGPCSFDFLNVEFYNLKKNNWLIGQLVKLLLALASTVILGLSPAGIHDHIFFSKNFACFEIRPSLQREVGGYDYYWSLPFYRV
jgi:hypothetical protein